MKLICLDHPEKVGEWAANYIIKTIKEKNPTPSRPFRLGLPTGSTPKNTYHHLRLKNQRQEISFRSVVTFNMDEYVGLSKNHPQSYHHFMHEHFFDHIDIPKNHIHLLDGTAADLQAECQRYELSITADPIDLFMGGVGRDGHIAFNEPTASLSGRTHVTYLSEQTRFDNARFFNGNLSEVPQRALTVGLGTLLEARELLILITGEAKALSLQAVVEGPVTHTYPISVLQHHPRVTLVCDTAATSELKVKTMSYFLRGQE